MDSQEALKLKEIADHQILVSKQYAKAREESGKAETELKLLLAPALNDISEGRKNMGIETALLRFIADNGSARKLYEEWHNKRAVYKGLEKIMDSYASKLITAQAIMKFVGTGEKWG